MKIEKRFYSDSYPQLFDERERIRIAKQLFSVLSTKVKNYNERSCLDIACSSGIISNYFSRYFKKVLGIDIDRKALVLAKTRFKKINLDFFYMNAEKMTFKNNSFDVVVCNQVYQFISHPKRMVLEVLRVMKPDGVLIITGPNLLSFFEAQTKLPLIHFLPDKLAAVVAGIRRKKYVHANYKTIFGMKAMLRDFKISDMTPFIIKYPSRFGYEKLEKFERITSKIPMPVLKFLSFFSPNFILVCEKVV